MKRKIATWILIVAVLQTGALRAQVTTQPTASAATAAANTVIDTPATPVEIVVGRSTEVVGHRAQRAGHRVEGGAEDAVLVVGADLCAGVEISLSDGGGGRLYAL